MSWFIGRGVLTGMLVTLKEFISTYPVGRGLLRVLSLAHHERGDLS